MNKLKLTDFDNGKKKINIGCLEQGIIDVLNIKREPCEIIMWKDRFKYIEKHKKDFDSEDQYYSHIAEIPNIIKNPDFVGLHPNDNSIQYIKRIDKLMLVGIRIKAKGCLNFRSSYPITQEQLDTYLRKGTAIELKNVLTSTHDTDKV